MELNNINNITETNTLQLKHFINVHLEEKLFNLHGFKILSHKQYLYICGGEFKIGSGNWNCLFLSYDLIKERWTQQTT